MSTPPLEGLRIVDFSHDWSGPHASRLLADLGAEVIRVEYFRRLDLMRGARVRERAYDRITRYRQLNRNKRSLALDLKDPTDRGVFLDLVGISDAVMANARPGVMERLGVGYETLRAAKRDVVLVSMTAYGQDGPCARYPAYGGALEAMSGLQSLTAYGPGAEPRRIREMDVTNGTLGAAALVTALAERDRTGESVWVDLSQLEAPSHALLGEHFLAEARAGGCDLPRGNRHPRRVPHGCYPCRGEDAWCVVSAANDAEWAALARTIGRADWARDPAFATASARRPRHDAIDEAIAGWTSRRDKLAVMATLQAAGVTAGAVLHAGDLHADPHLAARGYFRAPGGEESSARYPGLPFRLRGTAGWFRHRGPPLAEANEHVVRTLLGRDERDVRRISEDEIGTDFDVPGQVERY